MQTITSPIRLSSGLESSGRVLKKVESSSDRRESALIRLSGGSAAGLSAERVRQVLPAELKYPPELQPLVGDPACQTPGCKPFEYVSHRQHCLSCGNIFCSSCTKKKIANPTLKFDKPIPTCSSCVKEIRNSAALAAKREKEKKAAEASGGGVSCL